MHKRTKIVCTLGPASESLPTLLAMVKAGMNVARLNFSHGSYDTHALLMQNIRTAEAQTGEPITIMQDLQGPKIRVGDLGEKNIELISGQTITFDTSPRPSARAIPINFPDFHTYVKPGERILLSDGRVEVMITAQKNTELTATVTVGGTISSHAGINIPDSHIQLGALTDKDRRDAKFGVEHEVDFIALSFVESAKDIIDLRYCIAEYEAALKQKPEQPIRIIAKIERPGAVKNIKEILDAADGIMVARGDLGIEIPAEDVPLVQKRLIDAALEAAKPVIVATQMLDSMQTNPRPTRAEVSDVANAVIDHTDAVMLSNETATGQYPVGAVQTMSNIISETEKSVYDDLRIRPLPGKKHKLDEIISELSRVLAEHVDAKIILAASISGETGRLISRHRPELPIVVGTSTDRVRHQLNLSWGVIPFTLLPCRSIEELVERSIVQLKKIKIIKKGDKIVVVAGEPVGHAGHVNLLEVREVG